MQKNFHFVETTSVVFSTAPDVSSILPQSAIFGFLDDALEHKLLLNYILLIFKNYLHKARENKGLI